MVKEVASSPATAGRHWSRHGGQAGASVKPLRTVGPDHWLPATGYCPPNRRGYSLTGLRPMIYDDGASMVDGDVCRDANPSDCEPTPTAGRPPRRFRAHRRLRSRGRCTLGRAHRTRACGRHPATSPMRPACANAPGPSARPFERILSDDYEYPGASEAPQRRCSGCEEQDNGSRRPQQVCRHERSGHVPRDAQGSGRGSDVRLPRRRGVADLRQPVRKPDPVPADPPRAGRGPHGRRLRQGDRQDRRGAGHLGTGGVQPDHRPGDGPHGQRADGRVHRPGQKHADRQRRLPGGRRDGDHPAGHQA